MAADDTPLLTTAKEVIYLSSLLSGMGYHGNDVDTVRLMADNQSTIKLARNPINHSRNKHIRNKYHIVRQLVSRTELSITYVNTKNMIADGLTKSLATDAFKAFVAMMGLQERPTK